LCDADYALRTLAAAISWALGMCCDKMNEFTVGTMMSSWPFTSRLLSSAEK
jgi:hypothetical protein